jgi:hypothetical protein
MREKDQDIVGRILQTGAWLMLHSSRFRRDPAKLITVVDVRHAAELFYDSRLPIRRQ